MIVLFCALLMSLLVVAVLVGRALSCGSQTDPERMDAFLSGTSVADHYRPLERLLHKNDLIYLSSQAGVTPARIRRFRSQRRKLFRQYLSNLVSDFGGMCFLVKSLMIQSPVDRPDLAKALGKAQFTFSLTLIQIEFRLVAHAAGFDSIEIQVGDLMRALDAIGEQARMLQFANSPSLSY